MSEIIHSVNHDASADDAGLRRRLFRGMCGAIALAVVAGAMFATWRVATGLLLGGLLSLFNHHWLRTSVAAILSGTDASAAELRGRIKWRFILRYFIVAAIVCAAVMLNVVTVWATIAGLCAFAVALMIEASAQMYAAIVHREKF